MAPEALSSKAVLQGINKTAHPSPYLNLDTAPHCTPTELGRSVRWWQKTQAANSIHRWSLPYRPPPPPRPHTHTHTHTHKHKHMNSYGSKNWYWGIKWHHFPWWRGGGVVKWSYTDNEVKKELKDEGRIEWAEMLGERGWGEGGEGGTEHWISMYIYGEKKQCQVRVHR